VVRRSDSRGVRGEEERILDRWGMWEQDFRDKGDSSCACVCQVCIVQIYVHTLRVNTSSLSLLQCWSLMQGSLLKNPTLCLGPRSNMQIPPVVKGNASSDSRTTPNLQFLSLDTLPLEHPTHRERQSAARNRQEEAVRHSLVISEQNAFELIFRHDFPDVRRSGHHDEQWIHSRSLFGYLFDEGVREDVLRDGDADGAAEGVEEYPDGVADWHVAFT
jgi:hypothetical protein